MSGHEVSFTVYGEPVAQGRPRFTTIAGHARAFDPLKSSEYKRYVKLVASERRPSQPLEGALALSVDVYRAIPKSFSKKKRCAAESGELRPITKPDVDNFLKGIKDALKGVIWQDDAQVVAVTIGKWYSVQPRVHIEVKPL